MDINKLPDWRVAKAAEIAEDAVLPDGKIARKGDVVVLVTYTQGSREGRVTFATPGAPALYLNTAVRASRTAANFRLRIPWQSAPGGREKFLTGSGVDVLFDYFEHAMIAATSSYHALEAFANQIIANDPSPKHQHRRRDETIEVTGEELERIASTEEKLASVLPRLCAISSPKGKAVWGKFKRLKGVRDSITHLKSFDHYRRGGLDKESLYYRLLNSDAREYPRLAIEIMRYFSAPTGLLWLDEAERRLASDALSGRGDR